MGSAGLSDLDLYDQSELFSQLESENEDLRRQLALPELIEEEKNQLEQEVSDLKIALRENVEVTVQLERQLLKECNTATTKEVESNTA